MRTYLLLSAAVGAMTISAGQAWAEEAGAADAAEVSELVVYGQGESRQVQAITPQEIAVAAPGTSPIKLVAKLPGVNFQSSDPFGAYEWSTRISIRGFNQNQLGFTLDGVPLGDMSYGNYNGLHISRAIASEDLGGLELAQGAGALETASTSNLGGTLKFVSRDPSAEMGAVLSGTFGSNSTMRGVVQLETGELSTGGRAYLTYVEQRADKWKGDGEQKQTQVDFKFVQPIGPATLTGFYNASRRRENDYQDLSKAMISRLGSDWDNNTGRWAEAVAVAQIYLANPTGDCTTNNYPAPIKCVDDAYYNASGLRDDDLWGLTLGGPITETFKASATIYGHTNEGQGTWYTPYVPSPNYGVAGATSDNAPISVRTTEYNIDRTGVVANAEWTFGDHRLSFGGWYEDNDFNQARRFYALDLAEPQGNLEFFSNPFYTQWAYAFNTKTTQGYIQDVWTVSDVLKVNFGFKAVRVESSSTTTVGPPVINGEITSEDGFLPQVGVNYRLDDSNELFAGYSENIRAFGAAHTGLSPFATTQAGFDAIKDTLQPESSKTVEAGWRFRTGGLQGVLAAYYVQFDDRLIGTSAGAGIVGNPTILSNAGSVTSKGFEAAATWRLSDSWSVFGSYAYTDSKYEDDIVDATGAVVQKISGKTVLDTPKHLLNAEASFDNGDWFAKVSAHYFSKRYYTYTNDQSVGAAATIDLSAGYRFNGEGWMNGLEIQGNITNLFDKDYVSTMGTNGFGYSGDSQTLQTAAPRQVFVTVRKTF